eukprot:1162143-Pelagomonas_calceolata.AAC.13
MDYRLNFGPNWHLACTLKVDWTFSKGTLLKASSTLPSKQFGDGSVRLKSSKDAFRKLTVASTSSVAPSGSAKPLLSHSMHATMSKNTEV